MLAEPAVPAVCPLLASLPLTGSRAGPGRWYLDLITRQFGAVPATAFLRHAPRHPIQQRAHCASADMLAMTALRGLAWLLLFQAVGEAIGHALALPFPGPVIGMALLLPALRWAAVRLPVQAAAELLLAHLSLLFVPVGVGVITHLDLVSRYGFRLLAAIVASTWIGMTVTALVLRGLLPKAVNRSDHGE